LTISERRAALGNDTPVPKQMNGAVPRTRLGINRWLARDPLFGCYREKHDKAATARRSSCFAEHLVAGQSDVSENVVIELAKPST